MGLAEEPLPSGSSQAPVKPRVDELSFLGRSLLWDAPLFIAKLRRGKVMSRKKNNGLSVLGALSLFLLPFFFTTP